MSFCFLIHLWICPKHHYFPGLYLLTSVNQSLSLNSTQDSLSVLVGHSTQYQGKRALCYCQRWRWSHTCLFEPKIEIQQKGMRCYYGPQNSALQIKIVYTKKALRRVAQNKDTLPWLPICPSSSSHNVRPVSNLISISRLGNNAQEGQEPCWAGAGAARCSGGWHHSLEVQHAVQTGAPQAFGMIWLC